LLRPRLPASGDGFDPSDVTTCVSFGFGFGSGWDTARGRRWGLSHARRARSVPAPTERVEILRAYAIALCECCEACAAIEIAGALGACAAADVQAVVELGTRTKNILSRLVR